MSATMKFGVPILQNVSPKLNGPDGLILSEDMYIDRVNLRLILVSGKTEEFLFSPSTSASEIATHVFENLPSGWQEEEIESANILKLIYHGRFLHGNVTLGALSLPLGKTTVMHLVARENLPEPNSQDDIKKSKRGSCCNCCSLS